MKLKNLAAACLISAFPLCHSVATDRPFEKESFYPILAWDYSYEGQNYLAGNPPDREEQFRAMKECGFTVGFFRLEDLELARKVGLQTIVMDDRLMKYEWVAWLKGGKLEIDPAKAKEKILSLVEDVKKEEGVYGYYIVDEPGIAVLPEVGLLARMVREADPDRLIYVNLHPNYAPENHVGPEYKKYVEAFLASYKVNLISVDNYGLVRGDEPPEWSLDYKALFFTNMQLMRDKSVETGAPFWSVINATPHLVYPVPTDANLSIQAYASLAYGADGITHFTYFQNVDPGFKSAAIDLNGKKTPIWEVIKGVNREILALGPTMNQLVNDRNYFFGEVPRGSKAAPEDVLIPVSVKEGEQVLCGEFTHRDGSRYVMLVNTSIAGPIECKLDLPEGHAYQAVSATDGSSSPLASDQVVIGAGKGVLIHLAK